MLDSQSQIWNVSHVRKLQSDNIFVLKQIVQSQNKEFTNCFLQWTRIQIGTFLSMLNGPSNPEENSWAQLQTKIVIIYFDLDVSNLLGILLCKVWMEVKWREDKNNCNLACRSTAKFGNGCGIKLARNFNKGYCRSLFANVNAAKSNDTAFRVKS